MLETCPACKQEVMFVTEAQYDGFTKIGDKRRCTNCGYETGASAPTVKKADPFAGIFKDDDLPEVPQVFDGDENARFCRYCAHYVVNPFRQRCMKFEKDVDATDTCPSFEKMEE